MISTASLGRTVAPLLTGLAVVLVVGKRSNGVQQRLEAVEQGVAGLQVDVDRLRVDVARLRLTGVMATVDARVQSLEKLIKGEVEEHGRTSPGR